MTKSVSLALEEVISESVLLQLGLSHDIFNLTKLAGFLSPLITARTGTTPSIASVSMALSRLNRKDRPKQKKIASFEITSLSVIPHLAIATLYRTPLNHRTVQVIYNALQNREAFFTISEGSHEITIIYEQKHQAIIDSHLTERLKYFNDNVASLNIRFPSKYIATPGFFLEVIQQVSIQGINILELASTATELVLFLSHSNTKLAFDTIMSRFVKR